MLTIFGKKKKDDSSLGLDTGTDNQTPQTSYVPPPSTQPQTPPSVTTPTQTIPSPPSPVNNQQITPPLSPPTRMTTPGPSPRQLPLDASFPSEETSLSRILQSLLQDIPTDTGSSFPSIRQSTPEYVPLRATPPSRAMVI